MKYLVTGGAGFIGSNIVKELLRQGQEVRVLDNFATGKRENILPLLKNSKLTLIEGDLRSFHIARAAVKGVDYILHQGALPSVPRSINDPITSNDVNVLGTLNILEAAKEFGVKRVVCASSSSIYGNSETLPKVETMPVNPMSPYALTKYAQERYCQIFHQLYGLETVSLRYFNVFGPNQDPTSQYSAVIPKFIRLIQQEREPIIYGDGLQSRDFTFVENNVWANIQACTAEKAAGEVINIACGERYTLLDLVRMINEIMGKNVEPRFEPERPGDVKHSLAGIEKARQLLGYEVRVDFRAGLQQTIEFFQ
ncbi:MAG TPA: SDR family oxidoreductase [Candidatus Cloacimonadota bacterium]|jgi:UDP-glucose 4-epimerase|nr:SDR family oxidoreductase [Candidatus Cloacimonadota bacterium]HOR58180.1 SDR family oxidoreductase [Candidatus Cloacimonadota bacterium]HPL22761.1 SDR family oxidoreductase [Candidatus Cloacimonadota bacterium]HQO44413.1 SDR family oxidoreductase [Candidatus Cloacimonadota bacterium]HQP17705.1 SDR family oxidoreductase [Candidatus Cloacimonadota bacterium]